MRRRFMSNYMIGINNYLTIVALEDGLTSQFSTNGCEYCVDGDGDWKILSANTNTETINTGQTLSFRGNVIPGIKGIGTFMISKSCNLEGNCMSMLFGDEAVNNNSLEGKDYAFMNLFYNCKTIKSVSEGFLPATTLSDYCYRDMFYGCSNLTTTPRLPATILSRSCYEEMFRDCTNLTQAPSILPATTLAEYCYASMFRYCTNLTTTPRLPATTLAEYCYASMFRYCTNLTTTPRLPATTLENNCYQDMFYGTNVLPDCSNINFSVSSRGLIGLFSGTKVTDDDLERILPKNSNGKYCLPDTILSRGCYEEMFRDCTSLTTAPELPATRLADYCYSRMFYGCTNLIAAPELPATTLANNCYEYMFYGCTSLVNAPELPATTLASDCYHSMFYNCTSLVNAPELPATTLADRCYRYMFYYCTSLVNAPELPATTLASDCYHSMFYYCTSLLNAPELPATTLVFYCYDYMFYGCRKLNYIKAMFTTTPSTSYTSNWVKGVASTGKFIKNKNATWNVTGVNGIPSGWTVVNAITFTIGGTEYQAEEGMTWGEWVDSKYNTIGAYINTSGYLQYGSTYIVTPSYNRILSNALIMDGVSYIFNSVTGGGAD